MYPTIIEQYKQQIGQLCQKHHVDSLFLFGSAVSSNYHAQSDIDFLVSFACNEIPIADYFDNYMDFKESLEYLLLRPIDLVETQTLKNPILAKSIHQQKELLYARKN